MLSWNLSVKHILPVVLQAFHPLRQSPACLIILTALDQQWQPFNCITVSLSSFVPVDHHPRQGTGLDAPLLGPDELLLYFLSTWYAFKKNIWGCAKKIDLEMFEKDCEEKSWSAAAAANSWWQLALFEKCHCGQLLRGPLVWIDLSSFSPNHVTQMLFYCPLLPLGWIG